MHKIRRKYTKEQFEEAVKSCSSKRQVLLYLGLNETGCAYTSFNRAVLEWNIDCSHFIGRGWRKNRKFTPKRPIECYLNNEFKICSYKLKNKLIEEKFFNEECFNCKLTSWLNYKIPLELDHIDGNKDNNNLQNLRLLCPNCHALTPTYRGKNIGNYS